MWSHACALLEEAERRHRQFFNLLSGPVRPPVWEPPADVFIQEHELHIIVAMPGGTRCRRGGRTDIDRSAGARRKSLADSQRIGANFTNGDSLRPYGATH